MGIFGVGEIMRNLEQTSTRTVLEKRITGLMPTREDLRRMAGPILRGSMLGSALGILPGGGAILASFAAYSLEKKVSKRGKDSARESWKAWRRRRRPTTPGPRHRSSRC